MITREKIEEILRYIVDPEAGINIYDMGLIYDIQIHEEEKTIAIKMTLTSPGCPAGPDILTKIHDHLKAQPGVEKVKIDLVWSPRWSPQMMTQEARDQLGIY